MKICRMLFAVVGAAVLLSALTGSAIARRIGQTETRMTATFPRIEFRGGLGTTRCNLTLGASMHSRTLTKTAETLIGYVTQASVGGCEVGSATVLTATLPWHMRYESFSGTLPNIASMSSKVIGASFRISEPIFGIEALLTSTAGLSGILRWISEAVSGVIRRIRIRGRITASASIDVDVNGDSSSATPSTTVTLI